MLDRLMTRKTRVGVDVADVWLVLEAVANDDARKTFLGQVGADVSRVGGGAQDRAADSLALEELRCGFAGPAFLLDLRDDDIKPGRVRRFGHPGKDRDVIRGGERISPCVR